MPASLARLPEELILQIYHHLRGDDDPVTRTFHIGTSPAKKNEADCLVLASRRIHDTIRVEFLSTTTFHYLSPAEGSHYGGGSHLAAHDLLKWLRSVGTPEDSAHRQPAATRVRKLCLEMYASELLRLFAPVSAAGLLGMPLPDRRDSWSRVLAMLQALQLHELRVVILDHTCPRPCEGGGMNTSTRHTQRPINPDGSTPRHFIPDHRWVVKAVLETVAHLTPSVIQFHWVGYRLSRSEVDKISGCSWTMLHSSSSFHECDTLAYDTTLQRFWANVRDGKQVYKVPVVYGHSKREKHQAERNDGPISTTLGMKLDSIFGEEIVPI